MRMALLLTCTLLGPGTLFAASVKVAVPRMSFLTARSVEKICPAVDTACTTFERTSFECACHRRGAAWRPAVRIVSQPYMFISHAMYQLHELMHTSDLSRAMADYAQDVETNSFASFEACETYAAEQRMDFPRVIRSAVRASKRLRDHILLPDRD